jgi:predicted peptidase
MQPGVQPAERRRALRRFSMYSRLRGTALRLAAALFLVSSCSAVAQTIETGFLNRSVSVDGVEYRYQVYVPRDFRSSSTWPVILALHGGGAYGDDGILPTEGGLARAIRHHPERFPAIVVFPQSHADNTPGWQLKGGQAALLELDKAIAEFHGDPSRVYLTGYSAGGNGSWFLASHHSERFAALVVVCGFVSEFRGKTSGVEYPPIAPGTAPDPYLYVAKQVASLPIWVFHGDADKSVSVEESRNMLKALKSIDANVQYTEFPGVDHNAWDPAYDRADLLAWLLQQHRK